MEDGLPWGESPIDLKCDDKKWEPVFVEKSHGNKDSEEADPTVQSGWRWAWGVLISSSLALVLFNSHALSNWANQLPPNDLTAPIVSAADAWHDTAGRWGLNTVVDGVEHWAGRLRGA